LSLLLLGLRPAQCFEVWKLALVQKRKKERLLILATYTDWLVNETINDPSVWLVGRKLYSSDDVDGEEKNGIWYYFSVSEFLPLCQVTQHVQFVDF